MYFLKQTNKQNKINKSIQYLIWALKPTVDFDREPKALYYDLQ